MKPPDVQRVESAFLRAILRVASGSTAKAELHSFLMECESRHVVGINPKDDWFNNLARKVNAYRLSD